MRRAAGLVLVLALAAPAPASAPWKSAKEVAQAELEKPGYQTHLPGDPAHDEHAGRHVLPPGIGKILLILTWTLVVIGLAAFLFGVIQKRRPGRRVAVAASEPAAVATPRARPEPRPSLSLDDADRLASEGAFRDAVHALLVVAIGGTARTTAWSFPPSATSRELSRSLPLAPGLKEEFAALVSAVERSLFAGGAVDAVEYAACRERCLVLLRRAA